MSKKNFFICISYFILDLLFAIVQLMPFMGVKWFLLLYFNIYLGCFFLFCVVSVKDPGFLPKQSGSQLVTYLDLEYNNKSKMLSKNFLNDNIAAKYCYHCKIPKCTIRTTLICREIQTLRNL